MPDEPTESQVFLGEMVTLPNELQLGHTFRCIQGHVWSSYPAGFRAAITAREPEIRIAFDCPECRTLLIEMIDEA